MSTPTYTALATTTLSGSASSVTFSSIDQSYGDLVLVVNDSTSATNTVTVEIEPNGDSANGSLVYAEGDSTGTNSTTLSRIFYTSGSTNPSTSIVNIMDYSATDKHKTFLIRSANANDDNVFMIAGRWASTSAITSITLTDQGGQTIDAGSTFSLFGIAK